MDQGLLGFPKNRAPKPLYQRWDPYAIPDDGLCSISCEFTQPEDINRFIHVNVDGVSGLTADSAKTLGKGLWMNMPNLQYRWRAFLRAFPSTVFTAFLGAKPAAQAGGALVAACGLLVSSTATTNTGKQRSAIYGCFSDIHNIDRAELHWDNFGENATGAGSTDYGKAVVNHIRWQFDGTNHDLGWSEDGENYFKARTGALGFTPAFVGFYGLNYSGVDSSTAFDILASFSYFRVYPDIRNKSGRLITVFG